ncbi:MAG: MATE family efflux transporter, partial [Candidatus Omnitrophota bacterium]
SAVSGLALAVVGVFFSTTFVNFLNLPSEVKWLTVPFLMIYSIAFPFDYILMNTNGILRSCGMIKKSLWIMSVVCVMNIILDFYLAFYTPLKLNGIALATVISIFTGAALSMGYVGKFISGVKFSFSVAKNIIKISWPSGLLQAFWQLASLVLFLILSLLPRHNVEIMAALTNGLKIESAIFLPVFAFSLANAVIVGNLLGKREDNTAFRAGIVTALMGVLIATLMIVIVMFNARSIATLLSANGLVVSESMKYIYIALLFEPIMAWGVILGGGLNGAGDTMGVMVITSLSVWLVRIPLSYLLSIYFGLGAVSVWWAMNASIFVQAVFITKRYFTRQWIRKAEIIPA